MTRIEELSGLQLGMLVNQKLVSPVEVIKYFADRIEARNPSINAFVYTKIDEALAEAKEQEQRIMDGENIGPLAGVPIGLKDFLPTKKGWTASHGGVGFLITVDDVDSEFYKAARSAGAIAIGKTNAPAFGFRGLTDNKMYGPTSTPFKVGYNSGGSSGGSAAAVGDGLVMMAEGGDAGGSIRLPAAWCGCFGFKPSAGLVPSVCRPDAWTATHPYCCGGPITRTVSDAAVVLDRMIKYDPNDPLSVPLKINLINALGESVQGMRIGVTLDFSVFPEPDSEIVDAIFTIAKVLESAGATIVYDVKFPFKHTLQELQDSWFWGISIDTTIDSELWKDATNQDWIKEFPDQLSPEFIHWIKVTRKAGLRTYRKFTETRTDILDAHLKAFENCDVILAPVTGCMPVKNSKGKSLTAGPRTIAGKPVDQGLGFAYTYLENMIGFPAASVPAGISKSGLPIGVQIIAKRYDDEMIFTVARAIEQLHPWEYKIPFNRTC